MKYAVRKVYPVGWQIFEETNIVPVIPTVFKTHKEAVKAIADANLMYGGSIGSWFKGIGNKVNKLFSKRDGYPPAVRKWLEANGDKQIVSMTVMRTPIVAMLDKVLNALSFGNWQKNKDKYSYDSLFHLSLQCEYHEGGKTKFAYIEKNEVINISNSYKITDKTEYMKVPYSGRNTFNEIMKAGEDLMGTYHFLNYDAYRYNCQDFIINLLAGLGLLTPRAREVD